VIGASRTQARESRFLTTGTAFDSPRRSGLLRSMRGGLSSPGRPVTAPLCSVAFLKAIQLTQQFGLQVLRQIEILQRDFVFGALQIFDFVLLRFVLRMVHRLQS
jgi:hypothetical protein